MFVMLKDARSRSPTFDVEQCYWSDEIEHRSVVIPRGVAHGIYFAEDSVIVYGLSRAWTGEGELACHWADPAIKTRWPTQAPLLSDKDATAETLSELVAALEQSRSDQDP
jgi:dTDP-4-dehydrorhamnose 3,5-epimerase